ncbi:MAG: O-unit flippase-like protein [Sedimenticola sp.]
MAKAVKKNDVFWGYGAQAINIGAELLLLPVILYYLSSADVGLWFVFISLGGFAKLLEFGFLPTLARNTAYVYSGANQLTKESVPLASRSGEINNKLLAELIVSSRKIYRIVSAIAVVILLGIGTLYISTLLVPAQDENETIIAWLFFAAGHILTFYFGYVNGILQGRGDISQSNKVIAITRVSFVIFGLIAIFAGFGLLGLGVASLVSAGIGRIVAMRYFYLDKLSMRAVELWSDEVSTDLVRILWHNASRVGLVQLGGFLIQKGNILIAASILGTEATASYGLTLTILMAFSTVSSIIFQLNIPHLSALQVSGDNRCIASLYRKSLAASIVLYLIAYSMLLFFAEEFLMLINSNVMLLPNDMLSILALVVLLEMNHTIAATYLTTLNYVPFVKAALVSGVCVALLSFVLVTPLGVVGLILAQGGVQLAYNNWKWPLIVYQSLFNKSKYA